MVTATSELARNAVVYGLGGTKVWELLAEGVRKGLRLCGVAGVLCRDFVRGRDDATILVVSRSRKGDVHV